LIFLVLSPGSVRVVVHMGKIFEKRDVKGKGNLYVIVRFNDQEGKTSVKNDMKSPVWEEG
jgi:Ca2+-dependent lipid-binding protein